jgi:preprotein translocase subunit SecB
MAKSEPMQIQWSILEIKETEFFVDESAKPGQVNFSYQVVLDIKVAASSVSFSIIATYVNATTNEVILKSKSHTSYGIKNMESFTIKDEKGQDAVDLPDALWISLFSMAYSHARAMMARSAGSTIFKTLVLPPINPEAEFRKLFGPHMKDAAKLS